MAKTLRDRIRDLGRESPIGVILLVVKNPFCAANARIVTTHSAPDRGIEAETPDEFHPPRSALRSTRHRRSRRFDGLHNHSPASPASRSLMGPQGRRLP